MQYLIMLNLKSPASDSRDSELSYLQDESNLEARYDIRLTGTRYSGGVQHRWPMVSSGLRSEMRLLSFSSMRAGLAMQMMKAYGSMNPPRGKSRRLFEDWETPSQALYFTRRMVAIAG